MTLLRRLHQFLSGPHSDPATGAMYRAAVGQARAPAFYGDFGVPDSIDGRFDLLVLHVFLIIRRLAGHDRARQRLFDLMFADMDRSLREMGVGDMSIGKKIKPMLAGFYGRATAYEKALAQKDAALATALARNLYGKDQAPGAEAIADYVRRSDALLATQPVEEIFSGHIAFAALEKREAA